MMGVNAFIPRMSGKASVEMIRGSVEDKEFYPTTDEIIEVVKNDIHSKSSYKAISLLDIGAGDGRVLTGVMGDDIDDCDSRMKYDLNHQRGVNTLYGIEQSSQLTSLWHQNIIPAGTDFFDTDLMLIDARFTFTNPPFSLIEPWIYKVITESNSEFCYIVSPLRWRESETIKDAINKRNAEIESLGIFSFKNGDRPVKEGNDLAELFIVKLGHSDSKSFVAPLKLMLEEMLGEDRQEIPDHKKYPVKTRLQKSIKETSNQDHSLVKAGDYVEAMVELYEKEKAKIYEAISKLQSIDPSVLSGIGVNIYDATLNMRRELNNLRVSYWKELFQNTRDLGEIIDTDTTYTFSKLFEDQTKLEFNKANIRTVMLWCLRNVRAYCKIQTQKNIETLFTSVNIRAYKSNQSRFIDGDWDYAGHAPRGVSHFCLNTTKRLIISWYVRRVSDGAISSGKLHYNISNELKNLCVIANNIGFPVNNINEISDQNWESGKVREIFYTDKETGKTKTLFKAKVFKQGTIHLNMDKDFINFLNVEFGRMKGWVTTPKEAAEEMYMSEGEAERAFAALENKANQSIAQNLFQFEKNALLLN
ncbi:DUF4942 domain-containing protein [Vibrio sp. D431a]|uniref:DUF4942 domain-containing protein n=1 Tax=Vibrio sp. D431a TaxID=2837388 RepID=UPI002554EBEC|nr:DUF4942 domain-containing protein [Vibrio sp. D431a]MDK9793693.1 DUF4942 domain-containing protein [Vibrio sp. D431a]